MTLVFPELNSIPKIIEGENPQELGIAKLAENKLSNSTEMHNKWINDLNNTIEILDQNEINYVLMKYVDVPYAFMKDIDLLIENKYDVEKLTSALEEKNFLIYEKEMKKSDKVTAIGNISSGSRVEIDVYVDPTWWMIDYAPKGLISSKKIRRKISEKTVYLPFPTHDFFILATHSYWHGNVTISDTAQIIKLLLTEEINWEHLLFLAKTYHLEHPIYLYLSLAKNLFRKIKHRDTGLEKSIKKLESNPLCKLLMSTIKRSNKAFPLRIPYIFKIVSSCDEITQSIFDKKISYKEIESYFFALLLGRKIHV